jgi:hypothetical protein
MINDLWKLDTGLKKKGKNFAPEKKYVCLGSVTVIPNKI